MIGDYIKKCCYVAENFLYPTFYCIIVFPISVIISIEVNFLRGYYTMKEFNDLGWHQKQQL